ncbi:hypothetical protein [Parendozoicomonas sp. Alg238-R29]|uniref:hypothetical protein n=1 Tax=Parendozoicomonas sp. Alg238-R29 TaxID=2993446 RepID=UPI00248D5640|nr:hypothetical protein [Parendozoicomonas sp. Alg238-R29]
MAGQISLKLPLAVTIATACYLYFLLPATSSFFFELYHAVEIEFIYWLYSGFKVASVYLPRWEHYELAIIASGCFVGGTMILWRILRHSRRESVADTNQSQLT